VSKVLGRTVKGLLAIKKAPIRGLFYCSTKYEVRGSKDIPKCSDTNNSLKYVNPDSIFQTNLVLTGLTGSKDFLCTGMFSDPIFPLTTEFWLLTTSSIL
jgi:hypothetical protein